MRPILQRADTRLDNMFRCSEVRLADTKIDNIAPFCASAPALASTPKAVSVPSLSADGFNIVCPHATMLNFYLTIYIFFAY